MQIKLKSFLGSNLFILLLFFLIDVIFFWQFFFKGLIPIPADLIIGGYYPWLNEKWGYAVGVPVKNALMSDVVSLLYPWRLTAIELMKSGQLPLWDATSFFGTTLIGNFQAGVFNPFNLLFLLPFSFNRIWGLQVVIQPLIAMLCLYLMLRNWKLSKLSSIAGSISFAFSAQLLVWVEYNVHGFIVAAFPLLIFFLDKFLESKKIIYLTGIAVIFSYIIFVGYPQHIYYFGLFGLIYLIFLSYKKSNHKPLILNSLLFVLFVFLGLCLSGIVLLPGMEALNLSIKSLDSVALQNSVLYLPWQNLITSLIPDFFGNPATNNYYAVGYYESLIFYTTILILPFTFIGITKNSKRSLILAGFIILTLALALKTPLSELIQNISALGLKGSVSSRVLFIYGFAMSSLAAIGIDKFVTKSFKTEKLYLKYFPLISTISILTGIAISLFFIKFIIGDFALITKDYENIKISIKNSAIPLGLSLSIFVLIFVARFRAINRKLIIVLVITLILMDYFRFSAKYLPFISEDKIFPTTPALNHLKEQEKPFRIAIERGELLSANTWAVYGLESGSGYNILLPKNTADYISYLNSQSISGGYARFVEITNTNSKLLDLANINYYLILLRKEGVADGGGGDPFYLDKLKYQKSYQEGAVAIYTNKDSVNRFYSPSNILSSKSLPETFEIINSENFNTKNSAVIENDNAAPVTVVECQISSLNYAAQKISLKTNCPQEGFLAFSQVFYPGWKATINNNPSEILKTNGIFSGLKLPAGNSEITINYFPNSFIYGAFLTFGAAVSLLIINLISYKKYNKLIKK